jgi:hypothetical protein
VRQLDPVSNLVLSALAGLGLLGSLSLPWFVPPGHSTTDTDGPVERAAWQVSHFFGSNVPGKTSGSDALGSSRGLLVILVAVVAGLACAVAVPQIRKTAEDLLRMAGFAAPVAVIFLVVMHSGTDRPVTVHYGALVSFVAAAFMASAAFHGSSMRTRRKQAPRAIRISGS